MDESDEKDRQRGSGQRRGAGNGYKSFALCFEKMRNANAQFQGDAIYRPSGGSCRSRHPGTKREPNSLAIDGKID